MNTAQKIITASAIILAVGIFVTSDFTKESKEKADEFKNADGSGKRARKQPPIVPDPFMMLEVNPNEFPNFCGLVIADKNNPYGELFKNNELMRIGAGPFRRRA